MITFTVKNSQIAKYFKGDFNFVSYNLFDQDTWKNLLQSSILFMILPKHANTLEYTKKFILQAMDSEVKHIVKIGSLGPWRVVHKQIEQFILQSEIPYTSFDCAPLMNHIFIEQYNVDTGVLLDYRSGAPAPYLDPICLATAIEHSVGNSDHYNKNYSCTGRHQYTIYDIKDILDANGLPVHKIDTTTNKNLHGLYDNNADFNMMNIISKKYQTQKWYPPVSNQIEEIFGCQNRTFDQFVKQDKELYKTVYIDDKYL